MIDIKPLKPEYQMMLLPYLYLSYEGDGLVV